MKKLLLVALFCTMFCTSLFALGRVNVYQIDNATGEFQRTDIPTDTIAPKYSKIVGVTIMVYETQTLNAEGLLPTSENIVALYDTVNDNEGGTIAEVIAEAETANQEGGSDWFEYPLPINTQLQVIQGANTTVLIYYAR